MVDYDQLKRKIQEDEQIKERQKQMEEERQQREAERQQREAERQQRQRKEKEARIKEARERRKEIEAERWGTSEKAYDTWEQRTKEYIDFLKKCQQDFLKESKEVELCYQYKRFPFFKWNTFFPGFFGNWIKAREIYVSEFSYALRLDQFYENGKLCTKLSTDTYCLKVDGKEIYLDRHFNCEEHTFRLHENDQSELKEILELIWKPRIAADRIDTVPEILYDAEMFFRHGQKLIGASYMFNCQYPDEYSLEDSSTELKFGEFYLTIKNVKNAKTIQNIRKMLLEDFRVLTVCPNYTHSWDGSIC